MPIETQDLLPIGRFARLSGLTVKALRHYDAVGLLRPAYVDDSTGYRYYALPQAREAEAIRRLRELEVPLDEIAGLLHADGDTLRERLAVHRARLEGRVVETQQILATLDRLIHGEEELVSEQTLELNVTQVPEATYAVIHERAPQEQMNEVIPRLIERTGAWAHTVGVTGAPVSICPMDDEGYIDVRVGWPVATGETPPAPIEIVTCPASRAVVYRHVGPYEDLAASYRALAEAMDAAGIVPGPEPREIYESDPQEVRDPRAYVTQIVWPVT
jgi:DNA-binding transcriptional MerR regulator